MLSLGYPKINFQVANSLAEVQLLQTVTETVDMVKQSEDDSPHAANTVAHISKEQAFQVI